MRSIHRRSIGDSLSRPLLIAQHTQPAPSSLIRMIASSISFKRTSHAIRYGVGVGREGLAFAGTGTVRKKQEWPHWTPTSTMIAREPKRYAKWARGMDGGIGNPLGAQALYLFKDGKDTRYRIHGTTEPDSIGKAVSSGCIRMMNQDVIDLYSRVPLGTKVVVLPTHRYNTPARRLRNPVAVSRRLAVPNLEWNRRLPNWFPSRSRNPTRVSPSIASL